MTESIWPYIVQAVRRVCRHNDGFDYMGYFYDTKNPDVIYDAVYDEKTDRIHVYSYKKSNVKSFDRKELFNSPIQLELN